MKIMSDFHKNVKEIDGEYQEKNRQIIDEISNLQQRNDDLRMQIRKHEDHLIFNEIQSKGNQIQKI